MRLAICLNSESCPQGRVEDNLAPVSLETSRVKVYISLQTYFKTNCCFLLVFLFPVDPIAKFICDNRNRSAMREHW